MYDEHAIDTSGLSRYVCAAFMSLMVLWAMVHVNLHGIQLPVVVIPGEPVIVATNGPNGEGTARAQGTAGLADARLLGWPLRFMIASGNAPRYWTVPTHSNEAFVFSYLSLLANLLLAVLAAILTFQQCSRLYVPPRRGASILVALIATVLTLAGVIRGNMTLWQELATHMSVASLIVAVVATWAAVFDLVARLVARKAQVLPAHPSGAQMALTCYLEGIRLQEQ